MTEALMTTILSSLEGLTKGVGLYSIVNSAVNQDPNLAPIGIASLMAGYVLGRTQEYIVNTLKF